MTAVTSVTEGGTSWSIPEWVYIYLSLALFGVGMLVLKRVIQYSIKDVSGDVLASLQNDTNKAPTRVVATDVEEGLRQ